MTSSPLSAGASDSRIPTRLKLVDEHVRFENQHDLDGVMSTFAATARYDDEPSSDHRVGRDQVRAYYNEMLSAMPDLNIEIRERHATEDSVVLEVVISGHHGGAWRGLPPTGRRVEFPLCAIYSFDDADRLTGEKIYYDRATVLRQLGVFHEPERIMGRIGVVLMHPLTILRIARRMLLGR